MDARFTKTTLRAGFEPAREDPFGFQVQRLNQPAITAGEISLYLSNILMIP